MHDNAANVARAKGDPSKTLFIGMLTRDISLADCIVDLLDNSADGVKEYRKRRGIAVPERDEYAGYSVRIHFNGNVFSIEDNCGGIPLDVAMNYAFRFGRADEDDAELAESHTIGLYGIGMKRAMFKMGKRLWVRSSDGAESFTMALNVDDWRRQRDPADDTRDDWDFPLTDVIREHSDIPVGTRIEVSDLYPNVSHEFSRPGFANELAHSLRRQYAFIVSRGLELSVNDHPITAIMPTFKVAEEIAPMRVRQEFEGVMIDITAGLVSSPPEDDSAESTYPDAEIYGWYVVCNDRVVVAADKSSLTGWGVTPVPAWHNQYYGFLGVARFDADDPRLLPWTTTKRNIDASTEVYRRALAIMSECSKQFTDYTNKRKTEISRLKNIESSAHALNITRIPERPRILLPKPSGKKTGRIQYDKPLSEIEEVAKALKMRRVSKKEVGIKTFDYFRQREVLR